MSVRVSEWRVTSVCAWRVGLHHVRLACPAALVWWSASCFFFFIFFSLILLSSLSFSLFLSSPHLFSSLFSSFSISSPLSLFPPSEPLLPLLSTFLSFTPFLHAHFPSSLSFFPNFPFPAPSLPPSPSPSLSPSKFAYEARKPQDGKAKTKEGNEPKPAIRRRADTEKKEAHLENGNGNGNPCRGGGVEKRKWMEKMERRRKEYLRAGNQ